MASASYPIAPSGVFDTVQGEGLMLGVPMTFVRLAGCSVGCDGCDTDYREAERLTLGEIADRIERLPRREWVWVTGGEPTDHDLAPLLAGLRSMGLRAALATAGTRRVQEGAAARGWDFVSVSPHGLPSECRQWSGSQVNLVPGLGRLRLDDWADQDFRRFGARFCTPCAGRPESLAECREWMDRRRGFRLGVQAHRRWGLA